MDHLNPAVLYTPEGGSILINAKQWNGRWFLECNDARAMLEHIHGERLQASFGSGTKVRGVVIPGEGAFFELFDQFGSLVDEVVQLDDSEARKRILDVMVW